jgi:hypothetical protein
MTKTNQTPVASVMQATGIDAKAEFDAFKVWYRGQFPHSGTPSATSTLFDAWLASARHRIATTPPAIDLTPEIVAERCAQIAEQYPSTEYADIAIIRGIAKAIRSSFIPKGV